MIDESKIDYPLGEGFEVDSEGVWYTSILGEKITKTYVCAPMLVLAYARDGRNEHYSKLLQFYDPDNQIHHWLMPQELLAGDGTEIRKILLSKGLRLGEDRKAKELLTRYLLSCDPIQRVRSVDRIGWFGQTYVLPDRVLGKQLDEKISFIGSYSSQSPLQESGTLDEWKKKMAALCSDNHLLTFSVSMSFAGPLLDICHEENGGFHLRGASSVGKTTALFAAASVYGNKEFIQKWRATANGLEGTAKMYNDLPLLLDEMGEIHPREAGDVAYMLSNGTGKARADKTGSARERARWRCLFLSTGEISLAQHMLEDKKQAKAGQETRVADIPADIGEYGLFDSLHSFEDGAALSEAIKQAARECHGVAGKEYIECLAKDFEGAQNAVDATIDGFVALNVSGGASGQVKRVARRFALVAAAGELATSFGITGWEKGAATTSITECFKNWLEHRGNDQDLEERNILSKMQLFFELHGESRFISWDANLDVKTYQRAGFTKLEQGKIHYYVLPEVFKNEICLGFDWKRCAKLAVTKGFLMTDAEGKATRTEHLPGLGKTRCYRFVNIPTTEENREGASQ